MPAVLSRYAAGSKFHAHCGWKALVSRINFDWPLTDATACSTSRQRAVSVGDGLQLHPQRGLCRRASCVARSSAAPLSIAQSQ